MPISHTVDETTGILRVRRWGPISTQDEAQACRERAEDPLVQPDIPVLVDCREVDPPDSIDTVRYLADCISSIAHDLQCGPVAIVVATDVQFGMSRMYMSLTELSHPDTEVFRSMEEAESWLNKPIRS